MLDLLAEVNTHYHPDAPATRAVLAQHFYHKLIAAESALQLVVASDQTGRLMGFAGFFIHYSLTNPDPENAAQCLLKELFVSKDARRSGVGKALMRWLSAYAPDQACVRIDWPVNAENSNALDFYQSIGAELQTLRLNFRLSQTTMLDISQQHRSTP